MSSLLYDDAARQSSIACCTSVIPEVGPQPFAMPTLSIRTRGASHRKIARVRPCEGAASPP